MTDLCPSATMKVIEVAMHFLEIKAHYALEQPIDIVKDLSSAIRGVWGRSLRNIYCFQKQLDCINCSLVNCTYFVLFEKKLSNADQYHPYIIQSQVLNPNLIEARFKFFGWICEHSEKLLYSIINMNSRVLNRESVSHKLLLQDITDINGNILFTMSNPNIIRPKLKTLTFRPQIAPVIQLEFKTPLRQKHQGSLMSEFVWESFAKSLINRIRFIDQYFNRSELDIPEHIELDGVRTIEAITEWSEKIRVSYRQESKMSIGGLQGKVTLANVSPDMIAILKLSRYLHAGKQCSFGNGEIALRKMSDDLLI